MPRTGAARARSGLVLGIESSCDETAAAVVRERYRREAMVSAFRILGDWSDWYESIALDDVAFVAPSTGKTQVPICAQMSPCSCSD